jgi:hypothetical protein
VHKLVSVWERRKLKREQVKQEEDKQLSKNSHIYQKIKIKFKKGATKAHRKTTMKAIHFI